MAEKTYEEAMARLDEIIDLLENPDDIEIRFVLIFHSLLQSYYSSSSPR